MIGFYDLLAGNKTRNEVLPSAIAYRVYLRNQFNNVFTVLIFVPRFKSIIFLPK